MGCSGHGIMRSCSKHEIMMGFVGMRSLQIVRHSKCPLFLFKYYVCPLGTASAH